MNLIALDYKALLKALLPQGAAWSKEDGSVLSALLHGVAEEFARLNARANQLVEEVDPRTTTELLEDWERICGLPDGCLGQLAPTTQLRRLDVVAKLNAQGGSTVDFFLDIAGSAGYDITIDEFRAFRAGSGVSGGILYDEDWLHWFRVNSALDTVLYFLAGLNTAGDPLATWGNDRLECLINRHKPAHTQVIFAYS